MKPSRLPAAFLRTPIAHRGLHDKSVGRIENSLSAIRAAVDHGYGIEIDIQRDRAGTPLVFHDYTLNRLVGTAGNLVEKTPADRAVLKLSGSDEKIPEFSEVLDLVAGRVPLLVEIKDQDMRLGTNVGPLEAEVAAALSGYEGPVAVMSFNPHSVAAFASHAPDVPIGLVTDAFVQEEWPTVSAERLAELADIGDAETLGVDFVSHDHVSLRSAPIQRLQAAGMPILCWTIRSETEQSEALEVADQVTFEDYLPAI